MASESNYEIEYSAEDLGRRIGWIAWGPQGSAKYPELNVVTARITSESAKVGHLVVNGRRQYSIGVDEGFTDVLANHFVIEPEDTGVLSAHLFDTDFDREGHLLHHGLSSFNESELEKTWFDQSMAVEVLNGSLEKYNLANLYPELYYRINIAFGRGVQVNTTGKLNEPGTGFIVDTAMADCTLRQAEIASSILGKLTEIELLDRLTLRRLTISADISPRDASEIFKSSRLEVAEKEELLAQNGSQLLASDLTLLPVGVNRRWPYMDATESDPGIAFGEQVESLNTQELPPVVKEMRREIVEIGHRIRYAESGLRVLDALATAEHLE